jgi:hypothetical protein
MENGVFRWPTNIQKASVVNQGNANKLHNYKLAKMTTNVQVISWWECKAMQPSCTVGWVGITKVILTLYQHWHSIHQFYSTILSSESQTHTGASTHPSINYYDKNKVQDWWRGLSIRMLALQAWSPELKLQSHQKIATTTTKKKPKVYTRACQQFTSEYITQCLHSGRSKHQLHVTLWTLHRQHWVTDPRITIHAMRCHWHKV